MQCDSDDCHLVQCYSVYGDCLGCGLVTCYTAQWDCKDCGLVIHLNALVKCQSKKNYSLQKKCYMVDICRLGQIAAIVPHRKVPCGVHSQRIALTPSS